MLRPSPNYGLCTDPEDIRQLTDGKFSENNSEVMWTRKETVGWYYLNPVYITVDLGEVMPIGGVAFHTAAGAAGVKLPSSVEALVGDKEGEYYPVGDLMKDSGPSPTSYSTHWFRNDKLRTYGRYVTLVVSSSGDPYIFMDEIEVYPGETKFMNLSRSPLVKNIEGYVSSLSTHKYFIRRLRSDKKLIQDKVNTSKIPDTTRQEILSSLNAVGKELNALPFQYRENFRFVFPLDALHQKIFKVQAELWRARGLPDLTIWQSGLWENLSHMDDPVVNSNAAIRVDMMDNEYRAGAFNLSNATGEPMTIELQFSGLPGGNNPNYITIHEVAWTDTYKAGVVAVGLPEVPRKGETWQINVPSGLTRQVWMTFHPKNLKPGRYQGQVLLKYEKKSYQVPLVLNFYPFHFPDQPTLHFGGFDYINAGGADGKSITEKNRSQFLAHLRERFVDSPWATNILFAGTYDDMGGMITAPDVSVFDSWIKNWPKARRYYFHIAAGSQFDKFSIETPAFQTAVKSWIIFWADHARKKGIQPERIYFNLVDEPRGLATDNVLIPWAKAIRLARTGVKIWADPIYEDDFEDPDHKNKKPNVQVLELCDAICLNRLGFLLVANSMVRETYLNQRDRGAELQFYSCDGPSSELDPYSYYRLQAWTCWQYGAKGMHLWAFSDVGGGSSWNEFSSKRPGSNYCPFFIDSEGVTAAKYFEACREGIEDYEYFVMLKDAVTQAEKMGVGGELLNKAKRMLSELPEQVVKKGTGKKLRWNEKVNRQAADEARLHILEMLLLFKERIQ
jgi:hypothetical protein